MEPVNFTFVNAQDYVSMPDFQGDVIVEQLCPKDNLKCQTTLNAQQNFFGMFLLKSYNNTQKPWTRYEQVKGQILGHLGMMTNSSREYNLTGYPRYLKDKGLTKVDGFTL